MPMTVNLMISLDVSLTRTYGSGVDSGASTGKIVSDPPSFFRG